MNEMSLSTTVAVDGFAGAVVGLGVGYSLAPKKYSLKNLLTLKNDSFERIYTKDVIASMHPRETRAFRVIKSARASCEQARYGNKEEIIPAAREWVKEFSKVEIPKTLEAMRNSSKEKLKDAIKNSDYKNIYNNYLKLKSECKAAPNDKILRKTLLIANKDLSKAKNAIAETLNIYKNCIKTTRNSRIETIKNNPDNWVKARGCYHKFVNALAASRTAFSNRRFELINRKGVQSAYRNVERFIPKARTKSAILGALCLGSLTTIVASFVTKQCQDC